MKKPPEKAVKKMKVQGHERTSAVSAPPPIPLLAPRPGETLNTVQGYRFWHDLDGKPFSQEKIAKRLKQLKQEIGNQKTPRKLKKKFPTLKALQKACNVKLDVRQAAKKAAPHVEYVPDHDKLIDQIVTELNDLGAGIRRARKQAVLDEFGWSDFDGQLAKWKKRRQVFSVLEPEGKMSKAQYRRLTRDDEIFLLFQFADGKPIKAVKKIIVCLSG
jgi:hypothetical protein